MSGEKSEYLKAVERGIKPGYRLLGIFSDTDGYENKIPDKELEQKLANALNGLFDDIENGTFKQEFHDK